VMRSARLGLCFIVISLTVSATAFGTPYVESCRRFPYGDRVEQIIRSSWPSAIAPLIIWHGAAGATEIGIGITYEDGSPKLLRLEFDRSLHYSSQVEDLDDSQYLQVLNSVVIRVAHTSIPISEQFGAALEEFLESFEAASDDESGGVVVVSTGGGTELVLEDGRCLQLMPASQPTESQAMQAIVLSSFLRREMREWRPNRAEQFEAEATALIREASLVR
jgi:hypothetical protein